jgi:hypothetical protein
MTTRATMMVAQEKARSYVEQALGNDFIPLLLRHMDVFILILIHFLPLVHRPLSHVINDVL